MTHEDTVPDGYWERLAEVAQAWPTCAPETSERDPLLDLLGWT